MAASFFRGEKLRSFEKISNFLLNSDNLFLIIVIVVSNFCEETKMKIQKTAEKQDKKPMSHESIYKVMLYVTLVVAGAFLS